MVATSTTKFQELEIGATSLRHIERKDYSLHMTRINTAVLGNQSTSVLILLLLAPLKIPNLKL